MRTKNTKAAADTQGYLRKAGTAFVVEKTNTPSILPFVDLMSWKGGFALVKFQSNVKLIPTLRLVRLAKPTRYKGKVYYFRLESWLSDENRKLLRPLHYLWLSAKNEAEAQKAFAQRDKALRRPAAPQRQKAQTPRYPVEASDLYASQLLDEVNKSVEAAQWKVLSKPFPVTVKLKRAANAARQNQEKGMKVKNEYINDLERKAVHCWAVEAAKLLKDPLTLTAEYWQIKEIINEALQAKARGEDAIDYELAANWIHKDYCNMYYHEYADKVAEAIGWKFADTAERQRFVERVKRRSGRLGLKTLRERGPRPRKN